MSKLLLLTALVAAAATTEALAEYTPSVAMTAVHYAKLIKCAPDAINTNTCGVACTYFGGNFVNVTAWENVNDTQVVVGFNIQDNQVVVAFRGSTTVENFIEDAEFWKVDYPGCTGCKVHAGFYHTYMFAKARIFQLTAQLMQAHPSASLIVTGHSLGASQARLCAIDLLKAYPGNAVYDYTFGTPRTGNEAFAKYAESLRNEGLHYHVTHQADPVPHLPPMSWSYIHIPRAVWYDTKFPASQGGFKVCNGTAAQEDPTCSNSVPWYEYKVDDHFTYLGVWTGCGSHAGDTAGNSAHDAEMRGSLARLMANKAEVQRLFTSSRH